VAGLQKAIAQLMEGRQERPQEQADPPALAALLAELNGRVPAAERSLCEVFAREFFAKAPAAVLAGGDPAALAALAASAFAFWRSRGTPSVAVRVLAPQVEREGWHSPLTVIESVLDDRPFIVDTLCAAIEAEGGELRVLIHPVLGVDRRADGTVVRVGPPDVGTSRESFFHAEVARLSASPELQQRLAEHLHQVIRATDDYGAMRERVAAVAAALRERSLPAPWDDERIEAAAFCEWLAAKSFVFLGYREYDLHLTGDTGQAVVRPRRGLGILRDDSRSSYGSLRSVPPALRRRVEEPPLLLVSTTQAISPVHRRAPMDDITLKEVDATGRVIGLRRLLGLFTAKAYSDVGSEIPLLRRCLNEILARDGLVEGSHDYRDAIDLFNSFPREELFASHAEDIRDAMHAIVAADAASGIRVVCRSDALQRGMIVLVLLPRARFSTELHAQVSAVLSRHLRATVLHEHLALDDRPVARLHYYLAVPPDALEHPPLDALRGELDALLRTWDDELRTALARLHGHSETERLVSRYARILPSSYKASTSVADAVTDVRHLETLLATGAAQIELVHPTREGLPLTLKLYLSNETLVLSEFVPVLENLGFRVLGQDVIELRPPEGQRVGIHSFAVELAAAPTTPIERTAPLVVETMHAVRGRVAENDRLNALVTAAAMEWRAVDVLRAYVEHVRQTGVAARSTLIEALTVNPACARRLWESFAAKFDPSASPLGADERTVGAVAEAHSQALAALDAVQNLTHDRALRALINAVAATVRTNFYAVAPPLPIAVKLDAALMPHLQPPRPALETWVHGAGMQGVHLRAGRVARGGIRASDRPDDFRAEVLGLLRTQMVKNAVIVPVGAKGGFIVRGQRGASADPARVESAYRAYIEALLSITDNLERGQPIPPAGQLVYDAADPYLVVAADKGTATFSDLANDIALRRGFWLGDAFASGGSHGYDHKRLAITARGAWECARQHFRELGRDLDRETVSAIGIGDMSGDVFGNGLLRSRRLRLLAAFDHRDVFLDPDPDPEQSYRERERLFGVPRSRWTDYAAGVLSRGGGVYSRHAKSIPLSPEARAMLELDTTAHSGEDVVRAILRMKVDMLWNGGIGTYVKARDETDAEVADPANDPVRITAGELRAGVVVEGGNLGLTQRARIEYALAGGRINTDAIDNSGGVDLSDHEVNLKIALAPLVAEGTLTGTGRDAVLAELADATCESVLAHNRSQALALGLDQARSRTHLAGFRDLMAILEAEAGLDRQLVHLPTREALRARRPVSLGLTRPELAVLLAATKLDLQHRLVHSPLCDDPALEADLRAYFPAAFAERFGAAIQRHPLRREIIAVQIANQLVDRMGMTFLVHAVRDTGRDVVEIVRAWVIAWELADGDMLAGQLDAARDRSAGEGQRRCAGALADAVATATLWLVDSLPARRPIAEAIERFRAPVVDLLAAWTGLLTDERRAALARRVNELVAAGVGREVGERLALVAALADLLEVRHIAAEANVSLTAAAEAYIAIGQTLDLDWARDLLPTVLAGEDRWEPRAATGLLDGLRLARRQLTLDVLAHLRAGGSVAQALEAFEATVREQLDIVVGVVADVKASSQPTLPAVLVLMREIGRLTQLHRQQSRQ
jgi:glutamate dehydrogenase